MYESGSETRYQAAGLSILASAAVDASAHHVPRQAGCGSRGRVTEAEQGKECPARGTNSLGAGVAPVGRAADAPYCFPSWTAEVTPAQYSPNEQPLESAFLPVARIRSCKGSGDAVTSTGAVMILLGRTSGR